MSQRDCRVPIASSIGQPHVFVQFKGQVAKNASPAPHSELFFQLAKMQIKLILLAIAASVVVSAKALPQLDDTSAALLGIDDLEDADDGDFDEGDLVARDFKGRGAPISFIPTEALPKHKHHKHRVSRRPR
jgi:hypothetical protein